MPFGFAKYFFTEARHLSALSLGAKPDITAHVCALINILPCLCSWVPRGSPLSLKARMYHSPSQATSLITLPKLS